MARHSIGSGSLDLGGGSEPGRMKEYLLIAALAVIIIGSLVVTILYGLMGDAPKTRADQSIMFKCLECGAEFEYDPAKQPKFKPEDVPPMHSARVACQVCKKPFAALPMTKCPACGKYYLAAATLYEYEMELLELQGKDSSILGECPPTVCPHCKTDFHQWYRQHNTRRRSR